MSIVQRPPPPPPTDISEVQFLTFTDPGQWQTRTARAFVRAHTTRRQHRLSRQEDNFRNVTVPRQRKTTRARTLKTVRNTERSSGGKEAPSAPQPDTDIDSNPQTLAILTGHAKRFSSGAVAFQVLLLQDADNIVGVTIRRLGTDVRAVLEKYLTIIDSHAPDFQRSYGRGSLVTVRNHFYPLMFTDSACMAAMILLAASFVVRDRGEEPSQNMALMQLCSFATQRIQLGLTQSTEHGPSDQLISAVLLMAKWESVRGRRENHDVHMKGLCSLVHKRGGLSGLGLDGVLGCLIMCFDAVMAKSLGTKMYCTPSDAVSKVYEIVEVV